MCAQLDGWSIEIHFRLSQDKRVKTNEKFYIYRSPGGEPFRSQRKIWEHLGFKVPTRRDAEPAGPYRMAHTGRLPPQAPARGAVAPGSRAPAAPARMPAASSVNRAAAAPAKSVPMELILAPKGRDDRDTWIECDRCKKWRRLPGRTHRMVAQVWYCEMNPDPLHDDCSYEQESDPEEMEEGEEEAAAAGASSSAALPSLSAAPTTMAADPTTARPATASRAEGKRPIAPSITAGSRTTAATGKRPADEPFEGCLPPVAKACKSLEGRRVQSADGSTWEVALKTSPGNVWSYHWVFVDTTTRGPPPPPSRALPSQQQQQQVLQQAARREQDTTKSAADDERASMAPRSSVGTAIRPGGVESMPIVLDEEDSDDDGSGHLNDEASERASEGDAAAAPAATNAGGSGGGMVPAERRALRPSASHLAAQAERERAETSATAHGGPSGDTTHGDAAPAVSEHKHLVRQFMEHMAAIGESEDRIYSVVGLSTANRLAKWLGRPRYLALSAATEAEIDVSVAEYLGLPAPTPPPSAHAQIKQRLCELMDARGLTLTEVAAESGVLHATYISMWLGSSGDGFAAAKEAEIDAKLAAYLGRQSPASAASTAPATSDTPAAVDAAAAADASDWPRTLSPSSAALLPAEPAESEWPPEPAATSSDARAGEQVTHKWVCPNGCGYSCAKRQGLGGHKVSCPLRHLAQAVPPAPAAAASTSGGAAAARAGSDGGAEEDADVKLSMGEYKALVARLGQYRATTGASQISIAEAMRIGQSDLSRWLGGSKRYGEIDAKIAAFLAKQDQNPPAARASALSAAADLAYHALLVQRLEAHKASKGVAWAIVAAAVNVCPSFLSRWLGHAERPLAPDRENEVDAKVADYLEKASPRRVPEAAASAQDAGSLSAAAAPVASVSSQPTPMVVEPPVVAAAAAAEEEVMEETTWGERLERTVDDEIRRAAGGGVVGAASVVQPTSGQSSGLNADVVAAGPAASVGGGVHEDGIRRQLTRVPRQPSSSRLDTHRGIQYVALSSHRATTPGSDVGSISGSESEDDDDDDEACLFAKVDAVSGADWRTVQRPPAPPPVCACGAACVWLRDRWFCAREDGGCGFESGVPPDAPLTPLCRCAKPCKWLLNRWWCAKHPSSDSCGFESEPSVPSEPTRVVEVCSTSRHPSAFAMDVEAARSCAAMLTASAYGVDEWCFVAPTDCGLGLFARSALSKGQLICEYGGPHLPLEAITNGEYALEIPKTGLCIDGAYDNCPYKPVTPRSLGPYANHSSQPNARLLHIPGEGLDRILLVAATRIAAGHEVRFDYENGGRRGTYWGSRGQPAETRWKTLRLPTPPRTCTEPFFPEQLPQKAAPRCAHRRGTPSLYATESDGNGGGTGGGSDWTPLGWLNAHGGLEPTTIITWEGGGDAILKAVIDKLKRSEWLEQCGRRNDGKTRLWMLVASHLPGRSYVDCKRRWRLLNRSGGA